MRGNTRNPKTEVKKEKKVVDNTLSSNKVKAFATELKQHQKPISNFLRENDISIILGEAGCAKDFIQMYRAIDGVNNGEFNKIVVTKPIVELGQSVGFLPGLEDKFEPYTKSFFDSIYKIVGKDNSTKIKSKVIFEHIGFQRGNTFPEHSVVILSEAQNMTLHELISYTTRLPESSKLFINADPLQSDIGRRSGIKDFISIMENLDGVGIIELDPAIHQMRRKLIVDINRKYRELLKNK
jgi:phosphate starvation-inducible PhoH-like protein